MREFRGNLRSEHNRYIECEHHLAWKNLNSNFRKCVTKVYNLNWHHLRTDYQKNPLHLSRVELRDMRIMGLCSDFHMKRSLLDRMQSQLTESKNQYHELSCQRARRSSPGASPSHDFYFGMYEKLRSEYDMLRQSKKESAKPPLR